MSYRYLSKLGSASAVRIDVYQLYCLQMFLIIIEVHTMSMTATFVKIGQKNYYIIL